MNLFRYLFRNSNNAFYGVHFLRSRRRLKSHPTESNETFVDGKEESRRSSILVVDVPRFIARLDRTSKCRDNAMSDKASLDAKRRSPRNSAADTRRQFDSPPCNYPLSLSIIATR